VPPRAPLVAAVPARRNSDTYRAICPGAPQVRGALLFSTGPGPDARPIVRRTRAPNPRCREAAAPAPVASMWRVEAPHLVPRTVPGSCRAPPPLRPGGLQPHVSARSRPGWRRFPSYLRQQPRASAVLVRRMCAMRPRAVPRALVIAGSSECGAHCAVIYRALGWHAIANCNSSPRPWHGVRSSRREAEARERLLLARASARRARGLTRSGCALIHLARSRRC
jgi:hypothetical protein